ncbi:MAG TPA: MlaD family protein [Gemmatimonadaceae bacterium]|nr:MlaD family protein [Gemmatimonadaceae bacterium]
MKRRDEVTVGILLTVAVIVLITGTLWLVRGGLRRGYPLYTQFPWGQNLKQGQAVLLAGVTVGFVSDVRLDQRGFLDVDLSIQNKYKVPTTSVAEVYPVGIFGDVAVALKPSSPSQVFFRRGDTIPSRPATGGLDALQARADTITGSLSRVTRALETEFIQTGGLRDLRQTVASVNRLTQQMSTMIAEQNRNMSATLSSMRGAVDSAQIARTLASFRTTSASADSLMQRLSSNTTQLQAILARLERGDGTAGKLMTDTALYHDTRALLVHIDSLVSDFKQNPKKYINVRIF